MGLRPSERKLGGKYFIMPKKLKLQSLDNSFVNRREAYGYYMNRYYNFFMNNFHFPELDYQQNDFLLNQFWEVGTIGSFIAEGTRFEENPSGTLVLIPYAPAEYNIYNFPVWITPINKRGVDFIPNRKMLVDKEVVIGWCSRNRKGVKEFVSYLVNQIVDIEMVIKLNLNAHKQPWLLIGNPEDRAKLVELFDDIMNDESHLYLDSNEADKIKILTSGGQFIIDKLYNYKQAKENELREYLGIQNLGSAQKKEHLINSEVESNNQMIDLSRDSFSDCIDEWCERVTSILGYPLHLEVNIVEQETAEENKDLQQEEDEYE